VGVPRTLEKANGLVTFLLEETCCRKQLKMDAPSLERLQVLYKILSNQDAPKHLAKVEVKQLKNGYVELKITPVGCRRQPQTEKELKTAIQYVAFLFSFSITEFSFFFFFRKQKQADCYGPRLSTQQPVGA